MENQYNRVENLDELIRSVKLPYLAWKVLFLVNRQATNKEIAELLETDTNEIQSSLDVLVENGLISPEETTEEEARTPEPEVDPAPEVTEEPEIQLEDEVEESPEIAEEKAEAEIPLEELTAEAKEAQDEEESLVEPTVEEIPSEPTPEESAQDTVDDLLAEVEEDLEDEPLADEENEAELAETLTDSTEEEKIEINIPESDDADDISDEMEFNFNLTADEELTETVVEEQSKPAAEPQPAAEVDTSGFKKILVIDDSLVIRKMVEIALEEEDFTIETAVSGKEGLEIMDQTNPDLVILDMMLPDVNGIEILKTIKASKGLPVIMLSGKDSPQMIETAKNEGAEAFLPKPFKDDELVDKIKKLI